MRRDVGQLQRYFRDTFKDTQESKTAVKRFQQQLDGLENQLDNKKQYLEELKHEACVLKAKLLSSQDLLDRH